MFRDFYGDEANPFPGCEQRPLEFVYFRGKFFGKLCLVPDRCRREDCCRVVNRGERISSPFLRSDVDVGSSFNPVTVARLGSCNVNGYLSPSPPIRSPKFRKSQIFLPRQGSIARHREEFLEERNNNEAVTRSVRDRDAGEVAHPSSPEVVKQESAPFPRVPSPSPIILLAAVNALVRVES